VGPGAKPVFYYDLASPFCYLAALRMGRVLPVAPGVGAGMARRHLRCVGPGSEVRAAPANAELKAALRAATEGAVSRGVAGLPTVGVGGDLFWGEDRLEDAAAALSALA
jgi:2-hydroxychromene-2-carboxylate isomerase